MPKKNYRPELHSNLMQISYLLGPTISAKIITEMCGADLIVFRINLNANDCNSMQFKKIELIKTVMEINSLAGLFFEITDVVLSFFQPSPPHNSQRITTN